jgi:hypothetical protein
VAIEENCWADLGDKEFLIAHAVPPSSPIPVAIAHYQILNAMEIGDCGAVDKA